MASIDIICRTDDPCPIEILHARIERDIEFRLKVEALWKAHYNANREGYFENPWEGSEVFARLRKR